MHTSWPGVPMVRVQVWKGFQYGWFSKCSSSTIWELVRNTNFGVPPPCIRTLEAQQSVPSPTAWNVWEAPLSLIPSDSNYLSRAYHTLTGCICESKSGAPKELTVLCKDRKIKNYNNQKITEAKKCMRTLIRRLTLARINRKIPWRSGISDELGSKSQEFLGWRHAVWTSERWPSS